MLDSAGDGWNGGKFLVRNYTGGSSVDIFMVMNGTANAWASASYSIRQENSTSEEYNGTKNNSGPIQNDPITQPNGQILYLSVEGVDVTNGMSWAILDDTGLVLLNSKEFKDGNVRNYRFHMPGEKLWEETLSSGSEGTVSFGVRVGSKLSISLIPPRIGSGNTADDVKFAEMGLVLTSILPQSELTSFDVNGATLAQKRRVINQRFPIYNIPGEPFFGECFDAQAPAYQEINHEDSLFSPIASPAYYDMLDGFSKDNFVVSDGPYLYHFAKDKMRVIRTVSGAWGPVALTLPTSAFFDVPNFVAGFSHGEYTYLVSSNRTSGAVVRFHQDFVASKVTYLDLTPSNLVDFSAAFRSGDYGYLVPGKSGRSFVRIDLTSFQPMGQVGLHEIDSDYQDFAFGIATGDYAILVPKGSKAVRVNLTSLNVTELDFTSHRRLRNFHSAFKGIQDDVYLVPGRPSMAVKIHVPTLAYERLDLAGLELEGFRGGSMHLLGETGYFVGFTGTVVRFSLNTFTVLDQFKLNSWNYWDVNIHQVLVWGRYGVAFTEQNRNKFFLLGCGQAPEVATATPFVMISVYSTGMENVQAALRNSTAGAGTVEVRLFLRNAQGTGGGGTVLTVSDGVADLKQLSLPSGSQVVQDTITVDAGSQLFVTATRGSEMDNQNIDDSNISWALSDDQLMPIMTSEASPVGRWPVNLPVTAPGTLLSSMTYDAGPLQVDFLVGVADLLSWTMVSNGGVDLTSAFWGLYDHNREPILSFSPRSEAELPRHQGFTVRGGEVKVGDFTSTTRSSVTVTSVTSTSSSMTSSTVTTSTMTSSTSTTATFTQTSVTRTSSTTSTTLEGAYVLPDNVDSATPQGSVVQATLDSALLALNSPEESIVQVTPQGTVTVKKVSPAELATGLVFQLDSSGAITSEDTAAVTVQIPATTAAQAAAGLNLMLSLIQVTEEVSGEMPVSKEGGDTVTFTSKVLEFSLLQESGGLITLARVENAAEPIFFRFHEGEPVEGDTCVFFDLANNTWSSKGTVLVSGSEVPNNDLPGTWCSATHTSIFAVVQVIPFDLIYASQDLTLNASGATVAAALVFIMICCIGVPAIFVLLRRCKPASAGQMEIKDSKGRRHVVSYVRTEVLEETRTIHDDADDEVEEQKKKVLVKWDVDVDEMMRRVNTLRGHQWVSMDLGAGRVTDTLTMTKEASKSITKRKLGKGEASEGEEGDVVPTKTTRSELYGPMDSMDPDVETSPSNLNDAVPPERSFKADLTAEAAQEMIEVTVDDFGEKHAKHEVFEENAPVSYWSATHQRMLQGFIQGPGLFLDYQMGESNAAEFPHYDVRVGVRRQLRHAVPITHLEPSLQVQESVNVWVAEFNTWKPGTVTNCLFSAGMYQVMVFREEMKEIDEGVEETPPLVIDNVTLERIRRRYAKDKPVRVYRGYREGWVYGVIVEDVLPDLRPPPVLASPRGLQTPRAAVPGHVGAPARPAEDKDALAAEDREATLNVSRLDAELPETIVEVAVRISGSEETERVPSYLLMTLPECLAI